MLRPQWWLYEWRIITWDEDRSILAQELTEKQAIRWLRKYPPHIVFARRGLIGEEMWLNHDGELVRQ